MGPMGRPHKNGTHMAPPKAHNRRGGSPKSLLVFGSSSGSPPTCVRLFAAIHLPQRRAVDSSPLLSSPHESRHSHSLCSPPTRPFTSAPCHSSNVHKLFSLPVQFGFSPSSFASSPCPHNQPPSSKAAARLQRWPKQFASSASSCCLCLKGQRLIPTAYRSAFCWLLEHCSGNCWHVTWRVTSDV